MHPGWVVLAVVPLFGMLSAMVAQIVETRRLRADALTLRADVAALHDRLDRIEAAAAGRAKATPELPVSATRTGNYPAIGG